MTRMEKICTLLGSFFALLLTVGVNADGLHVRHATGGQSTALEVHGDYWYQTLGDKLVVIRKQGNGQVATRMLTSYPAGATCTDILIHDHLLYALLDGHSVVTFSLQDAQVPKIVNRTFASSLGVIPHELLMVGNWPVAIGDGGAIRLTDGKRIVACTGNVTGIAISMNRGIVFAVGNHLYDADNNESIGLATTLVELDDNANADIGTLVYTRDLDGYTEIGLMGGGMRTINSTTGKVVLPGEYRNMLARKSRLIVSTDEAVYVVGIAPDELRVLKTFDVQGVQDVDVIASNYLAMCGDFGRGVYRIKDDRGGEGGKLIRIVSSVGAMAPGVFDFRGVLVPSGNGSLYYGFDQTVSSSQESVEPVDVPTRAVVLGLEATIDTAIGDVTLLDAKGETTRLLLPSIATTIVPIEGNFWIGTHDGVYVFGRDTSGQCVELGHIGLAGPIVQLIPLFDGSAVFVSGAGMIGIVERNQTVVALEQ